MKKFLALTLVFMLCFSCLPGVAAFGMSDISLDNTNININKEPLINPSDSLLLEDSGVTTLGPIYISPIAGGVGPREPEPEESDNSLYMGPIWRLNFDYDKSGEKLASAATYLLPVSADGVYEYDPCYWLLDQMLNKLGSVDADHLRLELSAGSSGPVSAPALAPYTGGEAGEPVYSALFKLPAQGEGRSFPDDGIALFLKFPGDIIVSVPAQQATSVLDAIDLKVYGDRLVLGFVGGEDAEAYIELGGSGTPVWIDAEGNEVEAEHEYDEASGVYKIAAKPGLPLVFKA